MDESDSNTDLSNGDVGDAGGAVGVGAGEGEDFVELFAEGGGEGAVPDSVDEDEAAPAVLEILPQDLPEVVHLEVQGGPFGDAVAAGNPCRVIRKRFDDEFIAYLLDLKWWDWDIEKIEANFEALSSGDLTLIKKIGV